VFEEEMPLKLFHLKNKAKSSKKKTGELSNTPKQTSMQNLELFWQSLTPFLD